MFVYVPDWLVYGIAFGNQNENALVRSSYQGDCLVKLQLGSMHTFLQCDDTHLHYQLSYTHNNTIFIEYVFDSHYAKGNVMVLITGWYLYKITWGGIIWPNISGRQACTARLKKVSNPTSQILKFKWWEPRPF